MSAIPRLEKAGLGRLEPPAIRFANVGVPSALDRIPRSELIFKQMRIYSNKHDKV